MCMTKPKFETISYLYFAGVVAGVAVVFTENDGGYFGKIINQFNPCIHDPVQSAPCYITVNISVMLIASLLAVVLAVLLTLRLLKTSQAK